MTNIIFIDSEINPQSGEIFDLGAVSTDKHQLHTANRQQFSEFISDYVFIGGHNILAHDLQYLRESVDGIAEKQYIDTLLLSPLLFPVKQSHALLKDDKLLTDALNNPLNDAIKSLELFYDECNAFAELPPELQQIYFGLLHDREGFAAFFDYMEYHAEPETESLIRSAFSGMICEHAILHEMIMNHPLELAYCLAAIAADDRHALLPPWVRRNYPVTETYLHLLRNRVCADGCTYCRHMLDVRVKLKEIYGYDSFRTYNGEPLQEKAAQAAVERKSLLAIFPTGGGKSITFQLPALMAGETTGGLTVVISPLQSLMKDQVDNLKNLGIADAVTVNGLLSPIERAEALERVESGLATLLYLSPESLRSRTIEKLLLSRYVARFVIDEAHCFSAWGQDFRVDYLYIGDFIKSLQEKKRMQGNIPVSCFTATAKQKVVSDIREYFKQKLDLDLELFATDAARTNLRYEVLYKATDEEKYSTLRHLIEQRNCPTIVYVSRTKRTFELAAKLTADGFSARPYNGKMESTEKIANQEAFISGEVQIIVATSAFGMGVDKKDVRLVVHYDISDSLENYVQEAGRAGRDQSIQAECYVLFHEQDLDKHFILLNQTKLSISEIQQVWKAIKDLCRGRNFIRRSPLELARQAGWDDSAGDVETRVKTAVSALETAGYIKRGQNVPHIYATGILVKDMAEASERIHASYRLTDQQKQNALRIMKMLISSRSINGAMGDEAESRIDYISDLLGIEKRDVLDAVQYMREDGLLADTQDLTAYIKRTDTRNKSAQILNRFAALERFLLSICTEQAHCFLLKEINQSAEQQGLKSTVRNIKTVLYYWTIRHCIEKVYNTSDKYVDILFQLPIDELRLKVEKRLELASFLVDYLYEKAAESPVNAKEETLVQFSVLELQNAYAERPTLTQAEHVSFEEIQDALLYLAKIDALQLDGGFLVLYQAMEIRRIEMDNRIKYKVEDYRQLNEFYKQKIQQIHIVGEYANMMVRDYQEALQFVNDYFQMDYKLFLAKYFKGDRLGEINRNITPEKYRQLFDSLSETQRKIIDDDTSKYIVVTAGPGSGKTRVLVHKLASLLLLEDIKHEQLLMLTFSRAAATEFKQRLAELIGNAAHFIEIKTFHSYCFDLLGKVGSLEHSENIVRDAAAMIRNGEVEEGRITKTVVVIDEAQDMDVHEYALVEALMERNEDMRVIAVGDDDQNIYEFRGSDSGHLKSLIDVHGAKQYDLLDNYRSCRSIVALANRFVRNIQRRLKTEPIHAVSSEEGIVRLIRHTSPNLEYPVVNNLQSNPTDGTVCVLTSTNAEALRVTGLLKKMGIPARLIQSNDGFNLYDIAELRMFLKLISKTNTPIISEECWHDAIERLKTLYAGSDCLEWCMNLFAAFAAVNEKKYRSDLESFIRESQYADFCNADHSEVVVSTIHKAKGREFDAVYMLLNQVCFRTDEIRRQIYVGMTRAKKALYIHYNNHAFDDYAEDVQTDEIQYPEPSELILQLTHRDVFLDYFDKPGIKQMVLRHKSGDCLYLRGKL
ncbi:MAG: RecQ family ATP-dependent DNA helicase, partial [Oscillospiraceae bacterium]|nr:RecQ family ATP-dependent DNA helicase [Oscillospiraceae bacterium]